ncbi:52 kDa repressor of the inhibitor of the protein kinase-like [Aphis craccivora]|uniref:52 kDa repressor of the inhibitor of the protein kinase-like n=1 Tax=Aphis craccivora TaxID=307492 RepID=A0A6G0W4X2_APHCR|nr:52 kDa repressor of the inhibitor of the protein kinase-like [Aphis craccivora]
MSRPCGLKCAYVNCGKSARSDSGLKLFRFPKDVNTSRQWISNCGNLNLLHLDVADLYKMRICEHHFEKK